MLGRSLEDSEDWESEDIFSVSMRFAISGSSDEVEGCG